MKKIICLLLSLLMVLSLVACGKNDKKPDVETNDDLPTINREDIEFLDFWKLDSGLKEPKIEKIKVKETEIEGDIVYVSSTILNFDNYKVCEELKKLSYVKENYEKVFAYDGERHDAIEENKVMYMQIYDENYIDGENEDYNDTTISIRSEQRMNFYETPDWLEFTVWGANKTENDQKGIYEIAKVLYGEKIAEYLVYGEDKDWYDWSGMEQLENGTQLSDIYGEDGSEYELRRRVVDNGDTMDVTLCVNVHWNDYEQIFNHDFEDESKLYVENEFSASSVLTGTYPKLTPFDGTAFTEKMFKNLLPNYDRSTIFDWEYLTIKDGENEKINHEITIQCYDKDGMVIGSFNYEIDGEKLGDEIILQDIGISIRTEDLKNLSVEEYNNLGIKFGKELFADFECGELVKSEDDENQMEYDDLKLKINGLDTEGYLMIDHESKYIRIYSSFN